MTVLALAGTHREKAGETRLFSCALHTAVCMFNDVSIVFIHA
ncbi:hypothetical protein [Stenotrophomonas oahuensis]|uniref:Universal stress protein n=1 Tax=Stenotrophomonas oahuensis TaxID=3003271 RepID=A0ABY9YTV1_9GAMM|nr:hypothetical protein [Stenotrophomonas sp. A5586]WNH54364.1 hypothetical protein PDM29_08825 [Stenotrophomonas sp. A5586]